MNGFSEAVRSLTSGEDATTGFVRDGDDREEMLQRRKGACDDTALGTREKPGGWL
jgi:hypothetical protein